MWEFGSYFRMCWACGTWRRFCPGKSPSRRWCRMREATDLWVVKRNYFFSTIQWKLVSKLFFLAIKDVKAVRLSGHSSCQGIQAVNAINCHNTQARAMTQALAWHSSCQGSEDRPWIQGHPVDLSDWPWNQGYHVDRETAKNWRQACDL